jgi:hypothetical protein
MTFFTSSQCLLRSSGHKAFCAGLVGALIMPRWPKQNKHALREETVRTHEVVWGNHFAFYQPMPTHAADSCPLPDTITLHITPRLTERSAQPLLHADALPRLAPRHRTAGSSYVATPSIPTMPPTVEPFSRFKQPPSAQRRVSPHTRCVTTMTRMHRAGGSCDCTLRRFDHLSNNNLPKISTKAPYI